MNNKIFDNMINRINVISKSIEELTFSEQELQELLNCKDSIGEYIDGLIEYAKSKEPSNKTYDGRLLKLMRVLYNNYESNGQEGCIEEAESDWEDYLCVRQYYETKDERLKAKVHDLYSTMFRTDLDMNADVMALVGTQLENCFGEDLELPLYFEYIKQLYKKLNRLIKDECVYEFLIDLNKETCILLIMALVKLRYKYSDKPIRIIGLSTIDDSPRYLDMTYTRIYKDCVEKLDEYKVVAQSQHTVWFRQEKLYKEITNPRVRECIVFDKSVDETLKRIAKESYCEVRVIDMVVDIFTCSDCGKILREGTQDTLYCEKCGESMCIDCGAEHKFLCNKCR